MTIFENIIDYCKEDNIKLAEDIETWVADYFDLPHRLCPLDKREIEWIKRNLSKENQIRILGDLVDVYNSENFNDKGERK